MTARRVAFAIVLTTLLVLMFAAPRIVRWIAIDSCLDEGGRWDYAADRCVSPAASFLHAVSVPGDAQAS